MLYGLTSIHSSIDFTVVLFRCWSVWGLAQPEFRVAFVGVRLAARAHVRFFFFCGFVVIDLAERLTHALQAICLASYFFSGISCHLHNNNNNNKKKMRIHLKNKENKNKNDNNTFILNNSERCKLLCCVLTRALSLCVCVFIEPSSFWISSSMLLNDFFLFMDKFSTGCALLPSLIARTVSLPSVLTPRIKQAIIGPLISDGLSGLQIRTELRGLTAAQLRTLWELDWNKIIIKKIIVWVPGELEHLTFDTSHWGQVRGARAKYVRYIRSQSAVMWSGQRF